MPAGLPQTTRVYIYPYQTNAVVNSEFVVEARIADVVGLNAWQLILSFDPSMMECVRVSEGSFLIQVAPPIWIPPVIDNTSGDISIGEMLPTGLAISGSGTLAYVTFRCKAEGASILHIHDSMLADSQGIPLLHLLEDGTVNQILTHDVAVTAVKTSKDGGYPWPNVCQGCTFNVSITVKNEGSFTEDLTVTVCANSSAIGINAITDLPPNNQGSATIHFRIDTVTWLKGNYTIWANISSVPGETDTADNTLTGETVSVVPIGDLETDSIVDIFDVVLVAAVFGQEIGPIPPWNPTADANDDGIIDIFDIVIVAVHFAEAQGYSQKYHTSKEIASILQSFESDYPTLMKTRVIGHSYEGKEIWAAEITNFTNGDALTKPAMLYLGPHHGNEMIGKEIALYYIQYLVTNFGADANVTRILNEKTVYVIPCANVDGNDRTARGESQRFNSRPLDDDGDGLLDEDSGEDLDGDGRVTDMRKWNSTINDYDYFFGEGIDNDLDGLYNEDPTGGVDLNRNYPKGWNNNTGGGEYPLSEPETRAVRDFVISHPNIATVFDTHSGANCLLYPWTYTGSLPPDDQVYTALAAKYTALTGYPYHRIGAQGTSIDWIYENQSALCFVLELFGKGWYPGGATQFEIDYPDVNLPWQNLTHPQLGQVEIGGYWVFRAYNPPSSEIQKWALKVLPMLTDLVEITPKLRITELNAVESSGLLNISATIANLGFLATSTQQALTTQTNSPVNITLSFSGNVELVTGNQTVPFSVIAGEATSTAQWQVRITQPGEAWIKITASCAKGGVSEAYLALQ